MRGVDGVTLNRGWDFARRRWIREVSEVLGLQVGIKSLEASESAAMGVGRRLVYFPRGGNVGRMLDSGTSSDVVGGR